tara:strand:- start:408 stop:608 length:201 start_codon:yes stop_codon:yes gene_type:complete
VLKALQLLGYKGKQPTAGLLFEAQVNYHILASSVSQIPRAALHSYAHERYREVFPKRVFALARQSQ